MTSMFHTRIRTHEIGLRFKRGELVDVLLPGSHRKRFGTVDEIHSTLRVQFDHRLLEVLIEDERLRPHLEVVELTDRQRGLVQRAGRLLYLLKPGTYAFWKRSRGLEIEVRSIDEVRFEHPDLHQILESPASEGIIRSVQSGEHQRLIVYRDGEPEGLVGPGTYAYWVGASRITVARVDLREQTLDVAGQEIMSKDKVTLRVNMVVGYRIIDPMAYVSASGNSAQVLYRQAQLALREAVGGRDLDGLLTAKEEIAGEVRAALEAQAKALGLEVTGAGLRDVILPGEMKTILNQVIEAQKQAEANLIRRREETAAARSQAGTARLMAENPVLMRMKELEQLGTILAGARTTFVLGQGELSGQIRQMLADPGG